MAIIAKAHATLPQMLLVITARAKQIGRVRSITSARSLGFAYIPERAPCRRPPGACRLTMLAKAIAATEAACTNKIQRSLFVERTAAYMTRASGNTLEKSTITLTAPAFQTEDRTAANQS